MRGCLACTTSGSGRDLVATGREEEDEETDDDDDDEDEGRGESVGCVEEGPEGGGGMGI